MAAVVGEARQRIGRVPPVGFSGADGLAQLIGQYFVGVDGTDVAIYRGLPQDIGPLELSTLYQSTDVALATLPEYSREQVAAAITADDLTDARAKVAVLQAEAAACATTTALATCPGVG